MSIASRFFFSTLISFFVIGIANAADEPKKPVFKSYDKVQDEFKTHFGETPEKYFSKLREMEVVKKWKTDKDEHGTFRLVKDAKSEVLDKCRDDLTKVVNSFREERKKALDYTDPDKLSAKNLEGFKAMKALRAKLIPLMGRCGECTSYVKKMNDGDKAIEDGAIEGSNYYSKAVCYRGDKTKEEKDAAYERAKAFVSKFNNFTKRGKGFTFLTKFHEVVSSAEVKKPMESGFDVKVTHPKRAVLAVSMPPFLSFVYLIDNYYTERETSGIKELFIEFYKANDPKFDYNAVKVPAFPPGEGTAVQRELPDVKGYWYINSNGYAEYDTEGNFGKWTQFLDPENAFNIAVDTGWHLIDDKMFPIAEKPEVKKDK